MSADVGKSLLRDKIALDSHSLPKYISLVKRMRNEWMDEQMNE